MLVTLLGVSVVIFVVLRLLPGDAVSASLGVSEGLLEPRRSMPRSIDYYGIGQPAAEQFLSWLRAMLSGNLGISLASRTSVSSLIGQALPVTLEVGLVSLVLGVLLGVGLGMLGALHPGSCRTTSARASPWSASVCRAS